MSGVVCRAAVLGASFVLLAESVSAQLGHVVKAQKISETSGGFGGALDDQDQFGRSIVNLGDLNGDGISDLLVGSHTDDDGPDGKLDRGSVWILFLASNGFVQSQTKISEGHGGFAGWLDPGDQFGRAAARIGDLDGDGLPEIAVGANYDDDGGTNKGSVYVLFLNTDGTVRRVQKISETHGNLGVTLDIHDEFGRSITPLGDLDGDGVPDLCVGAPLDDDGGTQIGAAYVLFLNADGTVKDRHKISRLTDGIRLKPGDWFGFCGTNLGDLDGDGFLDIALGAVLDDDGGFNQGAVWILGLNPDGSVRSQGELNELTAGLPLDDIDQFGTSVTCLGDLDGDGVNDIAVGAVKDDDGGPEGSPDGDVGAVYVIYLRPDGTAKGFDKISDLLGEFPYPLDVGDWFGSALARLGGAPNDGLFNLAIGARYDNDGGGNNGSIYLVQVNDGTAPWARFTADRTHGIAPLTVQFLDQSGGDVTGWLWTVSDGPAKTAQNPTHTFQQPGSYTVKLSVKGPQGTATHTEVGYVVVSSGVLADFIATPESGPAPLVVAFDDVSQGNVTSWSWDLGDGTTSSESEPVHAYAAAGDYTVTLTVHGPDGTDTAVRADAVQVLPGPPTADFTVTDTYGAAPLTVAFADASAGVVTSWSWSFGDGEEGAGASTQHVYAEAGLYTVALTATGPGGSDTHTKTDWILVEVLPPVADLVAGPLEGPAPLVVAFEDRSTGAADWLWDFGDGESSTDRDASHVYTAPGAYTVTLDVAGPGGTDQLTLIDLVVVGLPLPVPDFAATPASGVAPLTVHFDDLSSADVSAWSWDFGDGETSTETSPDHVYALPGTYTVALTVQAAGGEATRVESDLVTVAWPAPVADFEALTTSGAAPLAVTFADASAGEISAWAWSFGDGTTSSDANPTHVYATPGVYTVTLLVTGPGGNDLRVRTDLVTVLVPPPLAEFAAGPELGFMPLPVSFTDRSTGAISSWLWSFGDGTTATARFPVKTYNVPGTYYPTLTVSGPGGSRSVTHGPIQVARLLVFKDGGFEKQTVGQVPRNGWVASGGTVRVLPLAGTTAEVTMPSEGLKWCELSAGATTPATPPSNPGGAGTPSTGGASLTQAFAYTPLAPYLFFEAAFVLGELPASPDRNDFMSIELTDGTTTWCVHHADTFTDVPLVSALYGLPMIERTPVHVDLRTLFPGAPNGTPLTLRVRVGNRGDALNPSRGYVDGFRFAPAALAMPRNGTGFNAQRYVSSPAVLGGTWDVQVDCTGHAKANLVTLSGTFRAASGVVRPAGEALIAGAKIFNQSWVTTGGLESRTFTLPIDPTLIGRCLSTQATISGGRAELTNAYDLILGF